MTVGLGSGRKRVFIVTRSPLWGCSVGCHVGIFERIRVMQLIWEELERAVQRTP